MVALSEEILSSRTDRHQPLMAALSVSVKEPTSGWAASPANRTEKLNSLKIAETGLFG